MRYLFSVLVLLCMIVLGCESDATAAASRTTSDVLEDIAKLDFSDYIREWDQDPTLRERLDTRQPTGSGETFESTYGVPAAGYDRIERLYLGDLTADGGFGGLYWAMKTIFMSDAYRRYGHFNFSGLELVQPVQTEAGPMEITTVEGYQAFKGLSGAQQFEQIAIAINPLTGKVYETFDSKEWSPGGMFVQPVTESVERLARGGAVGYYDNVWHVVVYGRAPGSILVEMDIVGKKQMRCYP